MKKDPVVPLSTTQFTVSGRFLSAALYETISKYKSERDTALKHIAEALIDSCKLGPSVTSASREENIAAQAAALLLALNTNTEARLVGPAHVVAGWLSRAVFLHNEIYELSHIQSNIDESNIYLVSLKEAMRYGLREGT